MKILWAKFLLYCAEFSNFQLKTLTLYDGFILDAFQKIFNHRFFGCTRNLEFTPNPLIKIAE